MKRLGILMCTFLLLFSFAVTAFSVETDGIDNGVEWDGATAYKLLDGESNCNVNFGLVKVKFDNKNNAIYLCFMFKDINLELDNQQVGISLKIEDSEPFLLTVNCSPSEYDVDKYSFEGAISVNENHGATCEVRLGIKHGLPQTVSGSVRFIDSQGSPSNFYNFTLVNEEYEEPTDVIMAPTRDSDDPAYNPDLLDEKTTRKSRKKTTTQKTTTEEFVIKTSPPYSYTGRTKASTTQRLKTSEFSAGKTVKTEKATQKSAGVTVYYYEKEVILSQVIVTQMVTQPEETSSVQTVNETEAVEAVLQDEEKIFSLTRGNKYKIISACICGALLLAIAVFGSINAKKDKNNSDSD